MAVFGKGRCASSQEGKCEGEADRRQWELCPLPCAAHLVSMAACGSRRFLESSGSWS